MAEGVHTKRKVYKALYADAMRRLKEKHRHERMVKMLLRMRARHAVQKWQNRAFRTVVARQDKLNLLNAVGLMRKRSCYAALKKEWQLKTSILKKLSAAQRDCDREHLRHAIA